MFVKNIKVKIKSLIPKNIFNYFHEKRLKKLQEFPESFSIETVNICNAKCWFCPQPDHKRQSMIRNINNIFHRLNLSEQEIRILLGIFSTSNELIKKT